MFVAVGHAHVSPSQPASPCRAQCTHQLSVLRLPRWLSHCYGLYCCQSYLILSKRLMQPSKLQRPTHNNPSIHRQINGRNHQRNPHSRRCRVCEQLHEPRPSSARAESAAAGRSDTCNQRSSMHVLLLLPAPAAAGWGPWLHARVHACVRAGCGSSMRRARTSSCGEANVGSCSVLRIRQALNLPSHIQAAGRRPYPMQAPASA